MQLQLLHGDQIVNQVALFKNVKRLDRCVDSGWMTRMFIFGDVVLKIFEAKLLAMKPAYNVTWS
ncbi:hypothetical protein V7S43_000456 [Phytophthora oleae]|uniref:Uncharacterized protein n=1 Tax=Phytophthora oleae TaxID=2107226 RepID=A0ABD3G5U0_9STRA